MDRTTLARAGAAAAALGGFAWTVKGAVTVATGDEPPYAYTVGLALLPLALLGLRALLPSGRATGVVAAAAAVAVAAVVAGALATALGPPAWRDVREETFTPVSATILATALGTLVASVAFGVAAWRARTFPDAGRGFPLALALGSPLLVASSGLLESLHPRLFEVPILLVGLGWIALAALAWQRARA